jgi:hypothetical protein
MYGATQLPSLDNVRGVEFSRSSSNNVTTPFLKSGRKRREVRQVVQENPHFTSNISRSGFTGDHKS